MARHEPAEPYGCAVCGISKGNHGWQYHSLMGVHQWIKPDLEMVLARMKARRSLRQQRKSGAS